MAYAYITDDDGIITVTFGRDHPDFLERNARFRRGTKPE